VPFFGTVDISAMASKIATSAANSNSKTDAQGSAFIWRNIRCTDAP
jgi:hypothetical protein